MLPLGNMPVLIFLMTLLQCRNMGSLYVSTLKWFINLLTLFKVNSNCDSGVYKILRVEKQLKRIDALNSS